MPTTIADAGCTVYCGQPTISACGEYELDEDPFIAIIEKPNRIFSIALGNITPKTAANNCGMNSANQHKMCIFSQASNPIY